MGKGCDALGKGNGFQICAEKGGDFSAAAMAKRGGKRKRFHGKGAPKGAVADGNQSFRQYEISPAFRGCAGKSGISDFAKTGRQDNFGKVI